jgi:hypothetical protein
VNWLKLEVKVLKSPAVLGSPHVHVSLWVQLQAYCAQVENGGVLEGAREWTEHMWLATIGPNFEVVRDQASALWLWRGYDLVVFGYAVQSEAHYERRRAAGRKGGQKTQEKRRIVSNGTGNNLEASAQATAQAGAQAIDRYIDRQIDLNASHSKAGAANLAVGRRRPIDFEDPLQSRMINVGRLFDRVRTTWWTPAELAAWEARGLGEIPTEYWNAQLETLRRYYKRDWRKEDDFRRRTLLALLEHWPDDVEACRRRLRADAAARDPGGLGRAVG